MHILFRFDLVIPICLLMAILTLLIKRGVQQRFRWFLIYVIYQLFEAILRLIVSGNKHAYFLVYWITSALAVILTVLAVRESFLNVLWAFARLRWFQRAFWICIGLAVTYSLLKAYLQPSTHGPLFVAIILHAEQTFEYLVCAAALFFFGAVHWFNIKKYQWEYRVMLGFLAIAVLANFGVLTRSIFGTRYGTVSEWFPAIAYIVGAFTWLLGFSLREYKDESKPPVDLTPEQIVAELDRYQQFITRARVWVRRQ